MEPLHIPPRGVYVALLGPLSVWRDGRELDAGSPQQRQVLALLLMHRNDRVSTEVLVDSLWREAVPANAVQTIRTYVSRLRRMLSGDDAVALVGLPAGYRMSVAPGRLDLDRFLTLAADGRNALVAGDPRRAEHRLRAALALFRGSPLAGFEHIDIAHHEAERIRELRLLVHEDLAEAMLTQGRHRELTPQLRELVAEDPYRERLAAFLMLALYRSGHQVEALAVYRRARATLVEELGLEPGRELRDLERRILLQERTLDHDMVGRLHGVPRYAGAFVGRRDALTALRRMLRHGRLVTVVGPAGVGKTRLAAEVGGELRSRFADGIWWVGLESAEGPHIASAIGRSLGIRDTGQESVAGQVIARLRGERALVVVDNCEHVATEVGPFAAEVLAATDSVHLLLTSREPLRLESEQVYALAPLEVPDAGARAKDILRSLPVRLLMARAGAAGLRTEFGSAEAHALRDVVERLDGLPLAIELAAAKLVTISPTELASSLEHGLGLLGDGERAAPARHRTLEAAIAWSYDSLSPDQQRALRLLSVFPASFEAEAARAVAGGDQASGDPDIVPVITRLVQTSLVAADLGNSTRYRLLAVVRAFARNQAERHGEINAAAQRHRAHYGVVAERVAAHMLDAGLGEWLRIGALEHDNLRAALQLSLSDGDGEVALQLASALAPFWFRIGHLAEGRALLQQALDLAGDSSQWRARGLMGRAWLADAAGASDAAEAARQALEAAEPGSERYAFALALVIHQEIRAGNRELADVGLSDARGVFERLGTTEGIALVDQLAGLSALQRGDLDHGIEHLTASRERYRELRGNLDAGWTLILLAQAGLAKRDISLAHSAASDAMRDFRSRGDQRGVAASLACLGRAQIVVGESEQARTLLAEALRLAETHGYEVEAADARRELDALSPR